MMKLLFTVIKGQISRFILKIARASSSFNFYFAENQIFSKAKIWKCKIHGDYNPQTTDIPPSNMQVTCDIDLCP